MDKEIQKTTLRSHVELARELNLPVIVPDRALGQETLDILEEMKTTRFGAIIQEFANDENYARVRS